MEVTTNSPEYRAVKSWLQGARPVTGLKALPESKRQAASARNAKLRQRLQNQRKAG